MEKGGGVRHEEGGGTVRERAQRNQGDAAVNCEGVGLSGSGIGSVGVGIRDRAGIRFGVRVTFGIECNAARMTAARRLTERMSW